MRVPVAAWRELLKGDPPRGDLNGALADLADQARGATVELVIRRRRAVARAWTTARGGVLLVPLDLHEAEIATFGPRTWPAPLAVAIGLGPRPLPAGEPLELRVGPAARLLAGERSGGDSERLGAVEEHFAVERVGGGRVEAVGADTGWWSIEPGDGTVTLTPTTATTLLRALFRLAAPSGP
jgi:hypothetical protein